jgi:hypothetical protein
MQGHEIALKHEPCMYLIKDPKGERLWVLSFFKSNSIAILKSTRTSRKTEKQKEHFKRIVGQPGPRPGANLEILWYVAAGYRPRTLYFSETRRQGDSNAGSIMDGA